MKISQKPFIYCGICTSIVFSGTDTILLNFMYMKKRSVIWGEIYLVDLLKLT